MAVKSRTLSVIGGDTYRGTHALEMAAPNGATIATLTINNKGSGIAGALVRASPSMPPVLAL